MVESVTRIVRSVDPDLDCLPKLSFRQITDRILRESLKAVIEESEEDIEDLSSIEKSSERICKTNSPGSSEQSSAPNSGVKK